MGILKGIKKSFKEGKRKRNFERKVQSEAGKIYEMEYRKQRMTTAKSNAIKLARQRVKTGKAKGSGVKDLFKGLGNLSQKSSGYWNQQMKGHKGKRGSSLF